MAESVNPIRPDGKLSRSAMDSLGESTSRQESIFGGQPRINIGPGESIVQGPAESFWIKITVVGGAECVGGYSATEVARKSFPVCDYIAEGDARKWEVGGNPAYEVNRRADVPVGKIVRAWASAVFGQIEFSYCG